jgi:hypothetical protein
MFYLHDVSKFGSGNRFYVFYYNYIFGYLYYFLFSVEGV